MKLADLHLNQFGARTGLSLHGISDELNVVYGPNGAGKTTVIEFIKWILFGQSDEGARRYLSAGGPSGGKITVRDKDGARVLSRTHTHGGFASPLTVEGRPHSAYDLHLGVSSGEFARFFAINFDQPRHIGDLLSAAHAAGFALHVDQRQLDRIRQLSHQLGQKHADLSRIGYAETIESLRSRRRDKERQIEVVRLDLQRRRDETERIRLASAAEVNERQIVANRLRSVVANIDSAIESRKAQLTAEHQEWTSAMRESDERRRDRTEELDRQVARWQTILVDVRKRLEQVRARISSFGDVSFSATEATDLRFFMRKLGFRIRDIEQDLLGIYETDTWRDHEADADYLRKLMGSALNAMQGDITRLCQTVEHQQQLNELHECREELSNLCRVEQELSDLVDALNRQRHQLARESEVSPRAYGTEAIASTPWLDGTDVFESLNDFRLRHLVERRESATGRLNAAELELSEHERRIRQLELELANTSHDDRIRALQHEVAEIDAQLRHLEQRHQLEREIASLEEELRRARQHTRQAEIVDNASEMLSRLTGGDYASIRVTATHECTVARSVDRQTPSYHELSRGVQDQVYLALSLAIASAFRERGVVCPLLLNDVFGNLDQRGTHSLSDVLADFAGRGFQVLLFTRHEHVRDLLASRAARIFTLGDLDSREPPVVNYGVPIAQPLPCVPEPADPAAPDPTYQWVAEWQQHQPPLASTSSGSHHDGVGLRLDSLLSEAPMLRDEFVEFLRNIGVVRVQQLIDLDLDWAEQQLGSHGITQEMLQRRQRELLMLVHLDVSVQDAQLLVACGVPDPARLGRADEAVLLKRVETILERPQAADRFGSFAQYSLSRVRGWIESAQRSGYRRRSKRGSTGQTSRRTSASRAPSKTHDDEPVSRQSTVKLNRASGLRFYLEVNDPIVDAPSIGPKTAQKLYEIDIYTVANLLDAVPAQVASQLNDRRITPDTVAQWQLQAQLVCGIPNLRGHDAQILVACGVEDPLTLSSMNATEFLSKVRKFVDSKEGQRVIRNGRKPDLAEVTAWIEWASASRQVRAA